MSDSGSKTAKPKRSIPDQLAELREILREENYRLPTAPRTTRDNAFVRVLDEWAEEDKQEIDAIVVSQADDPTAWEVEADIKPRRKRDQHLSSLSQVHDERAGRKR